MGNSIYDCPGCGFSIALCRCPSGGAAEKEKHKEAGITRKSKKSAVEILIVKPNSTIPQDQKGVHENLRIKQRFSQYLSIGVYLEDSDLQYYFFEDCDNTPKIYANLIELKQELPPELENIFDSTPKLFIMGHGHGGRYGLGNIHGRSEEIYGADFDKIITDFEEALSQQHDEISITLEACNTDNCAGAKAEGQEKTFLERLSANHRHITFGGTGPWDPQDGETGFRASGGFPVLNTPITAMGGGIWKNGNSVIFYHDTYQIVTIKSIFASTKTAKELKINTIEYAHEVLKKTSLGSVAIEKILTEIGSNRSILNIEDLKKIHGFPQEAFQDPEIPQLILNEKQIVEKEKNNYIARVQEILERAKSGEKFTERDLLIIALGLKNISVFDGYENYRDEILVNKFLLPQVMVTCGKVLISGPDNDSLIDLLLEKRIDINSCDEKGMTALHYTAQNFYNYRKEPLKLICKLLDCGANLEAEDKAGRTPLMLAKEHSQKGTVIAGENLLMLLEQKQISAHVMKSLLSTNLGFFTKFEDKTLSKQNADDAEAQHAHDKQFELVLKR